MTSVINIKDAPVDWKKNPEYLYIGRAGKGLGGKWGNPFKLESESDRATVLRKYIQWLQKQITYYSWPEEISELRDKILVCFCAPRLCHGDILALLADAEVYQ